ncbi:tRNA1(Val) (adenine(37)-N6)-methyltransferase [Flavimaricola marinus]|nr:methyltransferase domain-containing protein [Flavimaricola marinus]
MTSISGDNLTQDAFLGGRVQLLQPRKGYRAGIDPVLLAAAVPATSGELVLELGCGVGAALFCLGARVPGLTLAGIEVQPDYAELARQNAALNGMEAQIHTCDLRQLPGDLRNTCFHHVLANPPYYDRTKGSPAPDSGRDMALGGDTPMADWVETAARRLRPKGWLTLIQKADRLGEILTAATARLGSITVLPIAGRDGRDADRVIVQARKDGRAPLRLLAPLVLHTGPAHLRDGDDYGPFIRSILREGAALPRPR